MSDRGRYVEITELGDATDKWILTKEWITGEGVRIPAGTVLHAAPLRFQVDPDWSTMIHLGQIENVPDELIVDYDHVQACELEIPRCRQCTTAFGLQP